MKNLKNLLLGTTFLCLFINAFSQQQDRFWLVDEAVIKPDHVANFEESLKEIMQLFKENDFPHIIQVYSSTGFKYYFFRMVNELDSYDDMQTAVSECWSKIDQSIYNNYVQCFESDRQFIMKELRNYSYRPSMAVDWNKFNYGIWDVHYVKFDKIKEYLEVGDKFYSLVKKHEFEDPIISLEGIVGTENPMYAGLLLGEDVNDMVQKNQKMWKSFGEEGSELYQEMIKMLRGRDKIEFWHRRDLSYYKE